tara:strand:+ start:110 stop:319 length:210 start_codon:yes stop_codon:yes gene_type:complete
MLLIVQKNVLKINNYIKNILVKYSVVTQNNNIKIKKNTKAILKHSRLKRLEKQLKANIIKRKKAKNNNG